MIRKTIWIAVCLLCVGNFLLAQEQMSTRSKNVHIVDTSFFMPQLNRHRRVWIYLPESYATSRKKYPVLYMQDGQNIFDEATAFSGEWGVDETLDTLGNSLEECIVVAVDNGGEYRLNEYAPYDTVINRGNDTVQIKSEGDLYLNFLVKTLRPYINKYYRTKRCRRHTFIAGSSMGGLISFYAVLKYPKVFGGAGVFSPSFWIAPQISRLIEKRGRKVRSKIYFYAGKGEGTEVVTDLLSVFELMNKHSKTRMTTVIRAEGKHNEASWREEFPLFYNWLFTTQ